MNKVLSIILYLIIVCNSTPAQWKGGGSFKFKADIPDKGVGINISRNLPVQLPNWGLEIRVEVDLFRSSEVNTRGMKRNFLSEDYHTEIITVFFMRNFYPYFGFGGGYGHININELKKGSAIFSLLAGVRFPLSNLFYPYLEVQGVNYFADLDKRLAQKDISSFQLRGVIGISFIIK